MGFGKPQPRTKFEVASPSRCRNIIGEPKISGAFLAQDYTTFSSACDFMTGLGKPQLRAKFEVARPSCCRSIIGEPKILGNSPSQGSHQLFLLVGFDDGRWQTPAACQI